MSRAAEIFACIACAVCVSGTANADAYGDIVKAQSVFTSATSWHAEEHPRNGRTITIDYSAPDRFRFRPTPTITELVIGNDLYMVSNGKTMKLPISVDMVHKMIGKATLSVQGEIKASARDLGTQLLDGRSVHAYSYVADGVPVTLYVGPDRLPVRCVVNDKRGTLVINYSKFNAPIAIQAP